MKGLLLTGLVLAAGTGLAIAVIKKKAASAPSSSSDKTTTPSTSANSLVQTAQTLVQDATTKANEVVSTIATKIASDPVATSVSVYRPVVNTVVVQVPISSSILSITTGGRKYQ